MWYGKSTVTVSLLYYFRKVLGNTAKHGAYCYYQAYHVLVAIYAMLEAVTYLIYYWIHMTA